MGALPIYKLDIWVASMTYVWLGMLLRPDTAKLIRQKVGI